MDHVPMLNIMPFGMCTSLANPTVASATSAAMGVLTPMPCIPATTSPWVPGAPTVLEGNLPTLDNTCKFMCLWGGVVTVAYPGQVQRSAEHTSELQSLLRNPYAVFFLQKQTSKQFHQK